MLVAVPGIIKDNEIIISRDDIVPYNGRSVTIIINEEYSDDESQDKQAFFDAVGTIDIDKNAVDELRNASMI